MNRFVERLDRWATGRNLLFLGVVVVLFSLWILPPVTSTIEGYSGGVEILDLEFHYSGDEAASRIEAYGAGGRRLYAWMALTLDVVYPVAYAGFLSLLTLYFLQRGAPASPRLRRLAIVPFGAFLADILENVGITILLLAYPARLGGLAALVGIMTATKWIFVGLSVAVALLAAAWAGIRGGVLPGKREPE